MSTSAGLLPFPESPRVVYQKHPLTEVICQLRFPTVLEIGAKDPAEFQEDVRGAYPLYRRDETGGLPREVLDLVARLPIAKPDGVTHNFATEDSTRFIALSREFVALSDKGYSRWEHFRREIDRAKSALEKRYRPAFYSRIGLRYQDLIDRSRLGIADEPWHALLNPAFLGLLGDVQVRDRTQEMRCEAIINISDYVEGGSARVAHGLVDVNGSRAYLIDVDFFTEKRSASDGVFEGLDKFNRLAGNFFRWAITPRLHRALEPEDID